MKKWACFLLFPFIAFSQPQIAAIYNLTGDQSPLDVPSSKGAMLAAKHNKLNLRVFDGESNPDQIEKIARKLVKNKNIKMSMGLSENAMVASLLPTFYLAHKQFISSGATSPNLIIPYPHTLYLTAFGDNTQASAGAEYALKGLKQSNVFVIYDSSIQYTISLSSYFIMSYVHLGGHIKKVMPFTHNNFPRKYLEILKKNQPAFIYLTTDPVELVPIIRKIRKLGVRSIIMGGDSYTVDKLETLGSLANKIYFTTHIFLDEKNNNPQVKKFMKLYESQYHKMPTNAFAALGYDAVNIVSRALKGGGFDSIKDYKGVTGVFNYSHGRHIPLKSVAIVGFSNGKPSLKARLTPSFVPKPIQFIMK